MRLRGRGSPDQRAAQIAHPVGSFVGLRGDHSRRIRVAMPGVL
jgi:hypothetical protein